MHNLRNLIAALAVAGVVVTGCSSSSTSSGDDGGNDGPSSDGHTGKDTGSDGKSNPGDAKPPSDGGGDCAFADFVIGLINKDTTATATPSPDLGASLQDSQQQSCFSSLF